MVYTLSTTTAQIGEKMAFPVEVQVRFINRKDFMNREDHVMHLRSIVFCFYVCVKLVPLILICILVT